MNTEVKRRFRELNESQKPRVVGLMIHYLTIAARDAYDKSPQAGNRRLRAMNEKIHVAIGKLDDLLTGTTKTYPDDVFIDIVFDKYGTEWERDIIAAFEHAFSLATQADKAP
jgi:hypothetical protein